MRRGLVQPLFTHELEPGQSVKVALDFDHPFTEEAPLSEALLANIALVCGQPQRLVRLRKFKLEFWRDRAVHLRQLSLNQLDAVADPHHRRLLRGVPDGQTPVLGDFFHIALWKEMAQAGHCKDQDLIDQMLVGMNIVGPVQIRSMAAYASGS